MHLIVLDLLDSTIVFFYHQCRVVCLSCWFSQVVVPNHKYESEEDRSRNAIFCVEDQNYVQNSLLRSLVCHHHNNVPHVLVMDTDRTRRMEEVVSNHQKGTHHCDNGKEERLVRDWSEQDLVD